MKLVLQKTLTIYLSKPAGDKSPNNSHSDS